ncbi:hypothetical protein AAX29_00051 [Aliarcobacter thereius]|uniref:Uncharacterized protein n=1 Tax=Aliarcobacter thereius TaxID=544718 RepID=A0A1C0B902_9BACT|nr:hypothetical protein AAX29_00051 [Aliarcobacter thereius]
MINIIYFSKILFVMSIIVFGIKFLYNLYGNYLFYFLGILQIIYHIYIIFIKGINKEDFIKENIYNMKPIGASSFVWLIFIILVLIGLYIFDK